MSRGRRSRTGGARPPRRSRGPRSSPWHDAVDRADAVRRGGEARVVEQPVGLGFLGRHLGVDRQVERHDDHAQRDDRRAPLGGESRCEVDRLVRLAARDDRHQDRPVLERDRRAELERSEHGLAQRDPEPPAVEVVEDEAGREPRRGPAYRVAGSCCTTTSHARPVPMPADHGEQRPADLPDLHVGPDAVGLPRSPAACAASGSPRRGRS